MSDYANLQARLDNREVILLDGAIGTQLQTMGVPMSNRAWRALHSKIIHLRCGACTKITSRLEWT